MASAGHLEEHVRNDLDALRARLHRMSGLVQRALQDAVAALVNRDRKLGYAVVLRDHRIDALESHIDRLCQEFLVRHLPVAGQLRFVVSVIKVNTELERIGDYAESIARRAIDLALQPPQSVAPRLDAMAQMALAMLRQSVEAFLQEDDALARATLEMDREVNAAVRQIHADLAHPEQPTKDLDTIFTLLTIADRLERVADRACNVCEEAIYVHTGEVMRHLPREEQRVLFLSAANACRTQMAEAIGRKLAPPHLQFASAGVAPSALDDTASAVLARHGYEVARLRAKPLAEVGRLEDFHVVVTFGREALEASGRMPFKVIHLDWSNVPPPAASAPDARAEYGRLYSELRAKVSDLVDALGGAFLDKEEER